MPRGNARRLVAVLSAALAVWLYAYRLTYTPPRWEEPRRAIIAFEMLHNDDFVAPTVLGAPYARKPPLQNWLIAAFAGGDTARIDAHLSRFINVLAVFATAGFLIALAAPPGRMVRWRWLPGAIFVTMGIVFQYGRSGETDPLFTFWTTGALFFFELGRRRRNPWIKWVPSQLMVAGGFLTKGLSPLFFYPAVLVWELLERRRTPEEAVPARAYLQAGLGLAAMLVAVSAWVVAYALSGSLGELAAVGTDEILARTPVAGDIGAMLTHVVVFPLEVFGNILPWSLLAFALLRREVRELVMGLWRQEPYLRLLLVAVAWGMLMLWPMPGTIGRYAMPLYPPAAAAIALLIEHVSGQLRKTSMPMRRPVRTLAPWVLIGGFWSVLIVVSWLTRTDVSLVWPLAAGLLGIALAAVSDLQRWSLPRPTLWMLTLGLVYGGYYASVNESSNSVQDKERNAEVQALAKELMADAERLQLDAQQTPVACDRAVELRACFEIMKVLGRPLQRPPLVEGVGGYLFVRASDVPPPSGELVAERGSLRVWRR